MHQETAAEGTTVTIRGGARAESHVFPTPEEARGRAGVVNEALSWVGTPFRNCADVKGPNGGIDCAMLLVRSYVDSGRLAPFDPRPYPPDWFLHRSEERFLGWIEETLGARRVAEPMIGDVMIWRFGKCFSHGAIVINDDEVVHAYGIARVCLVSRILDNELDMVTVRGYEIKRPRLVFDVWGR